MAVAPTEPPSLTDVDDTLGIVGHGGGVTGSWVTVTIPPAPNVTVPIRREPSFRSTPIAKVPGDAEEEATSIQVSLAVTGQLQPLGPVTVTFCIPAADVKLNDLGVTSGGEPEPACVMTTRLPPIVTVPDRRQPAFAVTVIVRLPADAELAALIQGSLTVTGQLEPQLAPRDTVTDWLPPEAGKLNDLGVTSGGELEPAACVMTTRLPPIVTVPDRPQPVFALTVIAKLPADAELPALIHESLTVTGQLELQLAPRDTVTDWLPPEAGKLNDLGVTSGGELEPAACVMTTRLPPIVTVPDRPQPVFALTVIAKLPADAELPALIHESLTVTGQLELQLAPRDTVTDWLPPEAGKLNDLGVTSGGEPEPACVMTTRLPPIVTVPDRPQPVFAVTVIAKLPADAEPPALIHESLTVTGQLELQLAPRDTVTDWLPPEAGKLNDLGVTSGGELEPAACVMTTRLPPIVTVPDRPQPVFARTVIAKLPADAEPPALIHESLTVTGQLELQLAPRDTVTDWLPPEAGKLNDLGVTSGGELEPAACVMTTRLPPIVTVPDRPQPVFALTVIAKLPADAEPPALIHESLTVTGQLELQLAPRDTVTDRLPPEAGKLNDLGVTSGGELGPAACVMATLLPPIVTVPDRPQPVFALTVIAKLPADAEEATLIQVSLAVTGQLQPAGPATVTSRLPAADVNVNGVTPVGDAGHGSTMMGMFRPPMVTVPDCPALPERTVTLTRPSSDTLDGVVAIQARSSLTGQLQPAGPVTDRLSVPPAGGNLNDDGLTLVGDVGHGTTMTGNAGAHAAATCPCLQHHTRAGPPARAFAPPAVAVPSQG